MSNGNGTVPPTAPPGPTKPNEEALTSSGGGQERKGEKCRKTKIFRVYDDKGKYWVDVEVLMNGSFSGSQWEGPDAGNQGQETILQLVRKLTTDGNCGEIMKVGMNPDSPITGQPSGGSTKGNPTSVSVPARASAMLLSRNNVNRKFANKRKDLSCCKDIKRRVKFNDIGPEFLTADTGQDGSIPSDGGGGGGISGTPPPFGQGGPPGTTPPPKPGAARATARTSVGISTRATGSGGSGGSGGAATMPPTDSKKYKEAIHASDDGSDVFIDICIPDDFKLNRGRGLAAQQVQPSKIWKTGNVDLPGSTDQTDPKGPHFKLDPYQVPINFGPDYLAVEFYDGDGPVNPKTDT